ncbi:MAG: hypothetical protein ACXVCU_19495 [Bdellovibrio sp.]
MNRNSAEERGQCPIPSKGDKTVTQQVAGAAAAGAARNAVVSPWSLVGFFVSLIIMIFFGYSIWRVEKERKSALGSSKTHQEVLPKGGGGPLIH